MSVYIKDIPEWFELAVESMANQTHRPKEIIIISDGDISVLRQYHFRFSAGSLAFVVV